jgi:S-adenosylmethionine hydrolase
LIALLTDFGTGDWYVACVKSVILARCPQARLLDITHDVPPFDRIAGAFILRAAAAWLPPGSVCVCVVDPGVGTARRVLAAQADGRYYVGPDNGVLSLVLDAAQHRRLVYVTNRAYWQPHISQTFHGRDIMGPVAARLAQGLPLSRLGPATTHYAPLPLPRMARIGRTVRGCVAYIDHFGNLITNLPTSLLASQRFTCLTYRTHRCRVVPSYGTGQPRELIAVAGSTGYIEVALPSASAAARYRAKVGDRVLLHA